MTPSSTPRRPVPSPIRLTGLLALLLLGSSAALLGPVGSIPLHPSPTHSVAPLVTAPDPANPTLSIAPGSWSMEAGASVTLTGMLTGFAVGCSLDWATFAWSLPGIAEYDGFLNASVGPSVRFTSLPSAAGAMTIDAIANGVMECDGVPHSLSSDGWAGVAVLAEEEVGPLQLLPDPALPGERVVLEWSVSGGVAPYTAEVDFGDGASTSFTVSSPGEPFVAHRYAAGQFEPVVRMLDATGRELPTGSTEPLVVTAGLAASIGLAAVAVDVGVPFQLTANVTGGTPPFVYSWSDSLGDSSLSATWDLSAPTTQNLTVHLTVLDRLGEEVSVSRTIPVALPPSLTASTPSATVDVGRSFPFSLAVSGGVPPYRLTWSFSPNATPQSADLATAGRTLEPAVAQVPGEVWVTAEVQDAAGAVRSTTVPLAEAFALPRVSILSSPTLGEAGVPLAFTAIVEGGAPPVNWTWMASDPAENDSPASGGLPGPGEVRWRVAFDPAANVEWVVEITDAAGTTVSANGSLVLLAPVQAGLTVGSASSTAVGEVPAFADVSGGRPPYACTLWWSDGASAYGNLSAPGTLQFNATIAQPGPLGARLAVVDALGGVVVTRSNVTVLGAPAAPLPTPAPPSNPDGASGSSTSSLGSWAVGIGGLGVAAALFLLPRWRRRSARGGRREDDAAAMGAVRRLLKGTDGLERETLYFLADEEGVDGRAAGVAVDRWSRAGRILVEAGVDGGDLIRWIDPATGPSAVPSAEEEGEA